MVLYACASVGGPKLGVVCVRGADGRGARRADSVLLGGACLLDVGAGRAGGADSADLDDVGWAAGSGLVFACVHSSKHISQLLLNLIRMAIASITGGAVLVALRVGEASSVGGEVAGFDLDLREAAGRTARGAPFMSKNVTRNVFWDMKTNKAGIWQVPKSSMSNMPPMGGFMTFADIFKMGVSQMEVTMLVKGWLEDKEEAAALEEAHYISSGKLDRVDANGMFEALVKVFCEKHPGRIELKAKYDIADGSMRSMQVEDGWDLNVIAFALMTKKSNAAAPVEHPLMVMLDHNKETRETRIMVQLVPPEVVPRLDI